MRCFFCIAITLAAFCWSHVVAVAQTPGPPKIEVQQSANGTLDVGGAGAANPNATGANLRGNLGATVPQPVTATPGAPNIGLPKYSIETPNFGPDLRGPTPDRKPTKDEVRVAEEMILPRFRSERADRTIPLASTQQSDGWRYRHFNGRWWYWKPSETWAYWDGANWVNRAGRR